MVNGNARSCPATGAERATEKYHAHLFEVPSPAMACRARVRAHLIVRTNGHSTRGCYAMPQVSHPAYQALSLRRARLCHLLVAIDDAVELARGAQWACSWRCKATSARHPYRDLGAGDR